MLKALSKEQYNDEARSNIKAALAWRAWVWSELLLDVTKDDRDFLIDFCATGTATLSAYDEERDEWLQF